MSQPHISDKPDTYEMPPQRALLCAALLAAGRPLSEQDLLMVLQGSSPVATSTAISLSEAQQDANQAANDSETSSTPKDNAPDDILDEAADVVNDAPKLDIRALLRDLEHTLSANDLGLKVEEVAGGFRLVVAPHLTPALASLLSPPPLPSLSNAALETLALTAYKQPITRGELEACRGSSCSSTLETLQERELVRVTGHKNTIGKPLLYSTTQRFLLEFGLKSLADLPPLDDAPTDFVRS
jgi:segregation and condensation protein B